MTIYANTPEVGFSTMLSQEKPNPIGYKFIFTHLNRLCVVLPWLDASGNRLKFPLLFKKIT